MKTSSGVCVGHSELSVGGILGSHAGLLAGLPWALVTSVDSERDLSKWRLPARVKGKVELVGKAALVSTEVASAIAQASGFTGFDEVWLFRDRPADEPPDNVYLVGPADVESMGATLLGTIGDWMRASGCCLGLGDGSGLNYVSTDWPLAEAIEHAEEA